MSRVQEAAIDSRGGLLTVYMLTSTVCVSIDSQSSGHVAPSFRKAAIYWVDLFLVDYGQVNDQQVLFGGAGRVLLLIRLLLVVLDDLDVFAVDPVGQNVLANKQFTNYIDRLVVRLTLT